MQLRDTTDLKVHRKRYDFRIRSSVSRGDVGDVEMEMFLHLKHKRSSFEDSDAHILDGEDRRKD